VTLGPEALEEGGEPGREILVIEGGELVPPLAPEVVGLGSPVGETRRGAGLRECRDARAVRDAPIQIRAAQAARGRGIVVVAPIDIAQSPRCRVVSRLAGTHTAVLGSRSATRLVAAADAVVEPAEVADIAQERARGLAHRPTPVVVDAQYEVALSQPGVAGKGQLHTGH